MQDQKKNEQKKDAKDNLTHNSKDAAKQAAPEQKDEHISESKMIQDRLVKLKKIQDLGINPYPYKFNKTTSIHQIKEKHSAIAPQTETGEIASIAGRVMTVRDMGKAAFLNLSDESGNIQVYIRKDVVGDAQFELFSCLDLGDMIGVNGKIFSTKTGELSIFADRIEVLCKSLHPLPDKYHGITNPEFKYRKRYVDLIMNPESKDVFRKRSMIITSVRDTLSHKGFLEVDTPTLQPIYGGASAAPFVTELNALHTTLYMRISPELYLKRLLVGGYERVFEIARNFRNEGIDKTHNPEFTMMECYQAYADYNDMMDLTEEIVKNACQKVNGSLKVKAGEHEIDLSKFHRISMVDALKKYGNIDVDQMDDAELKNQVNAYALQIKGDLNRGTIINALFEELVEDKLIQPTFIMDHPVEVSPLTKIHRKDNRYTERFELFINGVEYANAYSELNDPIDQKQRLLKQLESRHLGDLEAMPMDEDFVRALEYGMPPAGGLGIGIDRLIILLTQQDTIKDIIFFPFMKPEAANEEKK